MKDHSASQESTAAGDREGPQPREQDLLGVEKAPCRSCPYRCDVPSGVWAAEEYAKLPGYDGSILDQLQSGAAALFLCHQRDGNLCAGWLACHGPHNLLAMRLHGAEVVPEVWAYETAVPVFGSGAQAAAHGAAGVRRPTTRAQRMVHRLIRTVGAAAPSDGPLGPHAGDCGRPDTNQKAPA